MIRFCSRFALPSATALWVLLLAATAPVQAAPSTLQTLDLKFTLAEILEADTNLPADEFLLLDVLTFGEAQPGPTFVSETGTGTTSSSLSEAFNGGPLGTFGDFEPVVGDMFSTSQTNSTSVPAGAGLGQLFETFVWDLQVENSSGVDLLFVFEWEYTRDIDLTEMGPGDSATVFLDEGTVSVDDFEGFSDSFDLFPDQLEPNNPPLNVGTLPPGVMLTLADTGTFTLPVNGVDSDSSQISIEWEIGARSLVIPEPSSVVLAGVSLVGLIAAYSRRRKRQAFR